MNKFVFALLVSSFAGFQAQASPNSWEIAYEQHNSAGKAGGGYAYPVLGPLSESKFGGNMTPSTSGNGGVVGDQVLLSSGPNHYTVSFQSSKPTALDSEHAAAFLEGIQMMPHRYQVVFPIQQSWAKAEDMKVKNLDSGELMSMDDFLESVAYYKRNFADMPTGFSKWLHPGRILSDDWKWIRGYEDPRISNRKDSGQPNSSPDGQSQGPKSSIAGGL